MVVAVSEGFDYARAVRQGARLRVATKYMQTAREHFAAKGVHVDLIKLYGSMELAPLVGLADAIVDLVSSGNTLRANRLRAVEEIAADQRAPDRQPGGAQAQARRDPAADRHALESRRERMPEIARLSTAQADFGGGSRSSLRSTRPWTRRSSARSRRFSSTCACGATPRCSITRSASTGSRLRASPNSSCRAANLKRRARNWSAGEREALEAAAARIRAFHERQLAESWQFTEPDGTMLGQRITRNRPRRAVRARRQGRLSVVGADERAARESGRSRRALHGSAHARRRAKSARARGGGDRGSGPRVHRRWRAGDRGARVWDADHPASGQDRRARERLRRGGQTPRVRDGRHRHGRRPLGDPRHLRRIDRSRTGSPWTCFRRPSTTRWRRPSSSRPTRGSSSGWPASIDKLLAAMPRREVIEASLARRGALIHAREPRGGVRDRQPHRARAS